MLQFDIEVRNDVIIILMEDAGAEDGDHGMLRRRADEGMQMIENGQNFLTAGRVTVLNDACVAACSKASHLDTVATECARECSACAC